MADTTQPSFGQGLDNLVKDLRKENDTLKDLNTRLQESLVTKDACIIKLNEKNPKPGKQDLGTAKNPLYRQFCRHIPTD